MAKNNFDPKKYFDVNLEIKNLNEVTINDVYKKELITHVDGRGDLTEIWSKAWNDKNLVDIEHVYYNLTDKGIIKGWHWHTETYSQFVCPAGKMQIVLIDLRKNKSSFGNVNQFIASSKHPLYLKIPPFVLKGWKALDEGALIVNLLSTSKKEDNYKIPYDSFVKDIWQPIFG